ncbi:terminase small subunit [Xanthomonas sp. WHRI 1810A]|uniref:terminase small subunit n=1 Tax=Xanthomonas sp. WHRI 1810A TaxID=3161565 RepID=UPI0032E92951
MALTSKKRAFIVAVREGASNKDAAIAAGCSGKTASAAGSRLAKDPDVIRELHKLNALFPVKADVKTDVKTGVKADVKADVKAKPVKAGRHALTPAIEPVERAAVSPDVLDEDPLAFFRSMMADDDMDPKLRLEAAKSLAAFTVQKPGDAGKKQEKENAAKAASKGKFGASAPPPSHLRSVK